MLKLQSCAAPSARQALDLGRGAVAAGNALRSLGLTAGRRGSGLAVQISHVLLNEVKCGVRLIYAIQPLATSLACGPLLSWCKPLPEAHTLPHKQLTSLCFPFSKEKAQSAYVMGVRYTYELHSANTAGKTDSFFHKQRIDSSWPCWLPRVKHS